MKKSTEDKYRFVSLVLILFGVINLILLIFFTGPVISFLSARIDALMPKAVEGTLGGIKGELAVAGLIFIALGIISYRIRLFSFLRSDRAINASLLVFALAWVIVTAEISLKLLAIPSSETYASYSPSSFSVHQLSRHDQDIKDFDGELQVVIRNGYRGTGFEAAKGEDEIRIVFIGGSFVFDYDAGPGRDWPRRVEEILRDRGHKNVSVINAGTPGHHTFDSAGRLLSEIHLFQPDYVVICQSWNDIKYFRDISPKNSLLRSMPGLSEKNYDPGTLGKFLEKSRLYLFLRWTVLSRAFWTRNVGSEGRLPEGDYSDSYSPWAYPQFKLNLCVFADICRNTGAEPVFFTQPRLVSPDNSAEERKKIKYEFQLMTHETLCTALSDCDRAIRETAMEKKAFFFDLSTPFTGNGELFVDHIHVNPHGSEKIAEASADYLESVIDGMVKPVE